MEKVGFEPRVFTAGDQQGHIFHWQLLELLDLAAIQTLKTDNAEDKVGWLVGYIVPC